MIDFGFLHLFVHDFLKKVFLEAAGQIPLVMKAGKVFKTLYVSSVPFI